MSARYYIDDITTEEADKLRKTNVCSECGAWLSYWKDLDGRYLACHNHGRTHHDGIARTYTPQDPKYIMGIDEMNNKAIVTRNQALATSGAKMTGVVSYEDARKIIDTLWGTAPEIEKYKAAMLCQDFGLHPLMNHVYLIPYKKRKQVNGRWEDDGFTWSTVLGIGATREIAAARGGTFSYIDNTPRIMTADEQVAIFGEVDKDNIVAITRLRTATGLEAQGYGKYPRSAEPKGTDKGNSKANMAFIRSERNAFKRLFPKDVIPNVEVVDEQYMPAPGETVDYTTGEIIDSEEAPVESTEVVDVTEELFPEDLIVEGEVVVEHEQSPDATPAPQQEPKNENVITPAQYTKLVKGIKELGWNSSDVGNYMNKDKGWSVKDLKTLKVWQYNEFMAMVKKNMEG